MVNKIRKNKKQKNLSEGKGKGSAGGPSDNPSNNNISIPVAGNEGPSLGTPPSNSMSDSYFKTKIAAEKAKSYLGSFKKNETNLIQTKPPEEQALTTSMSQIIPQNEIRKIKKPNYAIKNLKEKKLKKRSLFGRKKNNKKIDK